MNLSYESRRCYVASLERQTLEFFVPQVSDRCLSLISVSYLAAIIHPVSCSQSYGPLCPSATRLELSLAPTCRVSVSLWLYGKGAKEDEPPRSWFHSNLRFMILGSGIA